MVLGWLVIRTFFEPDITGPATAKAQAGGESPSDRLADRAELTPQDLAEIVRQDIFGSKDSNVNQTTGSVTGAEEKIETTEPAEKHLELQGTIAGPAAVAMAIIKDRQKNLTDLYKIGDAVGAARIVSIRKDAVILSENGRKMILKLDASRSRSATANPAKSASAGSKEPGAKLPSVRSQGNQRVEILEDILEKAVIEPAVYNNQTVGLRITKLDEIPMAKVLGLQEGDIIQGVNGQELSSKQKAFQVFRKAKTQPEIVLELIRDGKREALGFSLR